MPLYYTEGGEGLFARVNEICDTVEQDRRIRCSVHTRVLIFNSIAAIREDPSPAWISTFEQRQEATDRALEQLRALIPDIAGTEGVGVEGQLTFYQTLHGLTDRLDSLCPFRKMPGGTLRAQ